MEELFTKKGQRMSKFKRLLTMGLTGLLAFGMFTGCESPTVSSSCEHTYEWVGFEGGHQKVYTCGCPYLDVAELHSDNDKNAYCDICGYYVGVGQSIEPIYPVEKSYFEVIDELQISDIERIEKTEYQGSVSPYHRAPDQHTITNSLQDVESVYTWLKDLQATIASVPDSEAQVEGGSSTVFLIHTADYYFKIIKNPRDYLYINGKYYAHSSEIPDIVGGETSYTFETYSDKAELYLGGEKVKEYSFDFEQLVCVNANKQLTGKYLYKLVTDFGELYLYDGTHFIRDNRVYEIVGMVDFSQIFEEFTYQPSIISLSAEIESQFDLTGKKYWWHSGTNADFADDSILICFQKTTTYPELSVEDFMYENAESISYICLRPTGGQYENAEKYTQIAEITLKEKGRDKVIEAVQYFERISIIVAAEPNYLWSADGSPDPINANG